MYRILSLDGGGLHGLISARLMQLLADRYHRLQIVFDPKETIPMDSVKKLDRMDEIASAYDLSRTIKWIKEVWF
jgi:hypothetical protein